MKLLKRPNSDIGNSTGKAIPWVKAMKTRTIMFEYLKYMKMSWPE